MFAARTILALVSGALCLYAHANTEPDWSADVRLTPGQDRANIYSLPDAQLKALVWKGKAHAVRYPVEVTGITIPYRPIKNFLESGQDNPLKKLLREITKKQIGFNDMEGLYKWVGLPEYPPLELGDVFSPYNVPLPTGENLKRPQAMGVTYIETTQGTALTFSCAACHSTNLFGRSVLGLPNKQPRANEFFMMGRKYAHLIDPNLMALATKATPGEKEIFKRAQKNLRAVNGVQPQVFGLDASLAQTALSLMLREEDEYATRSRLRELRPRKNALSHFVADSKPMPWWTTKYKTRWLADGSIVSGNPIYTNLLWNELGRGSDLHQMEAWLQDNAAKVQELTAAVFATKPPQWTDYFGPLGLNVIKARRGQQLFDNTCARCHGNYEKRWPLPGTTKVVYHAKTPVIDVGTDKQRAEGMKHFAEDLNRLALSKKYGIVVEPQSGYVPPPLVGIWARYPYFHNGSAPSLCAVLTPAAQRPKVFYLGPAENPLTDFDAECVGYPTGDKVPKKWVNDEQKLDTSIAGLSNRGHESMLLNPDGSEKFSADDKKALIEFLKTL